MWSNAQGAMLIKNLAAREPSALGLDTYYKQYYLCLAAASATIKWYFQKFELTLCLTGKYNFISEYASLGELEDVC